MTDREAIGRILKGEKDLFEVLVARYGRQIRLRANRMTPRASSAEDVAQETFVRAYFSLDSLRGEDLLHWLYGILRNITRDLYRDAARRHEVSMGDLPDHIMELSEEYPVAPEGEDARRRMDECLGRLSEQSRRLVALRYEDGRTGKEIGSILEKTEFAVNMALMRIRRSLRRCLAGEAGGEI